MHIDLTPTRPATIVVTNTKQRPWVSTREQRAETDCTSTETEPSDPCQQKLPPGQHTHKKTRRLQVETRIRWETYQWAPRPTLSAHPGSIPSRRHSRYGVDTSTRRVAPNTEKNKHSCMLVKSTRREAPNSDKYTNILRSPWIHTTHNSRIST